jgi:hypothetical protein
MTNETAEKETIKIEGQLWVRWYTSDSQYIKPHFHYWFEPYALDSYSNKENAENGYTHIGPYTIEIEKPKDADLTKKALKGLQKQRKLILAENESRLNTIDGHIQGLLAIEHKP